MNNPNKFKLYKTNNFQTSYIKPIQPELRKSLYAHKSLSIRAQTYYKQTPQNIIKPKINATKLDKTTSNLFINQSLESSNKLDDLLKRCREIGSSDKSPKQTDLIPKEVIPSSKLIRNEPMVKNKRFNQFRLVKKAVTSETVHLLAIRRKNYLKTQLKLNNPNNRFKLNNIKSLNSFVALSSSSRLTRFKLNKYPTKTSLFIKSTNPLITKKSLYKVNNLNSVQKISTIKRFNLVKLCNKNR